MSADDMEYLRQSVASHDRLIGELVESDARNARQISELGLRIEQFVIATETGFARVHLSLDLLGKAMRGLTEHVDAHERRIADLEKN